MPTSTTASRLVLAAALAVPTLAAFAALPNQDGPGRTAVVAPPVLQRFVEHAGRPAQLQFDSAQRTLTVVGEARRPFAYDDTTDPDRPLWWTTIGPLDLAPELRFLIHEEWRRALDEGDLEPTGLPQRYDDDPNFAVLPVAFGGEVTGYVNTNPGDLDERDPTHFRRLPSIEGLSAYVVVGTSGNLDLVVPHDAIAARLYAGEGEGDGSAQRLGGLQIDLVFDVALARVPVSSLLWLGPIDRTSAPIERYRLERR